MTLKEQTEMIRKEMKMYEMVADRTEASLKKCFFKSSKLKKTNLIAYCKKRKAEYEAVLETLLKCCEG